MSQVFSVGSLHSISPGVQYIFQEFSHICQDGAGNGHVQVHGQVVRGPGLSRTVVRRQAEVFQVAAGKKMDRTLLVRIKAPRGFPVVERVDRPEPGHEPSRVTWFYHVWIRSPEGFIPRFYEEGSQDLRYLGVKVRIEPIFQDAGQ